MPNDVVGGRLSLAVEKVGGGGNCPKATKLKIISFKLFKYRDS